MLDYMYNIVILEDRMAYSVEYDIDIWYES
jgi:hypothetical protein